MQSNIIFRLADAADFAALKKLGIRSWSQFKPQLTKDNWDKLCDNLHNDGTYLELLGKASCIVCEEETGLLIGMAYLVPSGNPTDVFDESWCYISFVTVHPDFRGKGIGRLLTVKCIELARENKETVIALHSSELMVQARHIYESLGFKRLRELDQRLGMRYWLYSMNI